ncbi:DNA adenine methylase [Stenotrophomonas sp. CFBP 13725]|nr:DNA adenine methylase [Stenotrophomonas sp. CFBP 13725]
MPNPRPDQPHCRPPPSVARRYHGLEFRRQSRDQGHRLNPQEDAIDRVPVEHEAFLRSQLITYIGNKRALLPFVEAGIVHAMACLQKPTIHFLDMFSGSGVVARLARRYAATLHCNDLERYSEVGNRCYQANAQEVDTGALADELDRVARRVAQDSAPGFLCELYAPRDDDNIEPGERVFYTRRNAMFLDTFCQVVADTPEELKPFLLGPVLAQASMYTNTSGVFKGFHKNREGIGQFGGSARNALSRILRPIEVQPPVFSRFACEVQLHRRDANALVRELGMVDVAYFDPPYNEHPYGSNYFMLNLLCDYQRPSQVSRVSGIPTDWNRSDYNKARLAESALFDAVAQVRAHFVLISYNSEGFISHERFVAGLEGMGALSVMDTRYNAFRGSRNLAARDTHVTEFLYLLDKR